MIKKSYNIFVCVANDEETRARMISELAVRLGFAAIRSDARKIIRKSVFDFELHTAYFVMAESYNFRDSPSTSKHLVKMAAGGMAVIVGTKKIPREMEMFCDIFHAEDLL